MQESKTSSLMDCRYEHLIGINHDGVHTINTSDLKSCKNAAAIQERGAGCSVSLTSERRNIIASSVHT